MRGNGGRGAQSIRSPIKPCSTALCAELAHLARRKHRDVIDRMWSTALEWHRVTGRRISVTTLRCVKRPELPGRWAAGPLGASPELATTLHGPKKKILFVLS